MRSFWPRRGAQQPGQILRLDRSNSIGTISALLPASKFNDMVRGAPGAAYVTSVANTPDRYQFGATGSVVAWDDTSANFFRLPSFTRVLRFRLRSTANGFIHTVDNRFNVGIGIESIPSGQLGVSWYDGAFQVISTAPVIGVDYTMVVVSNPTGVTVYLNGKMIGSLASGSIVYQTGRGARLGAADYFGLAGAIFDLQFTSFSSLPMSAVIARQVSANPSLLFANDVPMRYVAVTSAASYSLSASQGSLTLTGNSIGMYVGRKLQASAGSLTLTGNAANLSVARSLAAGAGSLTLTGNAVTLRAARSLAAGAGALTLTGNSIALRAARTLAAGAGALTLTGNDIQLKVGRSLTAGSSALTLTGNDVTLSRSYKLSAGAGALTLTGSSIEMRPGYRLAAQAGALTLTGGDAVLKAERTLQAGSGTLTLTGQSISMTYTPPGVKILFAGAGALTLSGGDANLSVKRNLTLGPSTLTLSGSDIQMKAARSMNAAGSVLTLTGQAVDMKAPLPAGRSLTDADISAIAAAVWAHPEAKKLLTVSKFLALH